MKVVSLLFVLFLAAIMSGCAPKLITNQSPMVGADGKAIRVMAATTRDRTGTELQGQVWQDEDGKVLAAFQGAGPGIINNAAQGAIGEALEGGSILGAAALLRPSHTNVNNSSGSGDTVVANGGNATQTQGQGQNQSQFQRQKQGQFQGQRQTLNNCNTVNAGWTPPGQR